MADWPERDVEKIAKGWSIAMNYSKDRIKRIYDLEDDQMEEAINEGRVVLETVCLFMHACVKHGQYKLPLEFWRVLHGEYGIIVYPSAFTEDIDVHGLGTDVTFTEAYHGHILMFPRCDGTKHCPRCPFEFLQEPPPVYTK
ncbi:Fc.00g037530.m01.CDS01 [Cosmosporella sp. VM-42]